MKRLAKFLLVLIPVAILLLALHPLGLRVHFEDPTAGAHDVYYPYYEKGRWHRCYEVYFDSIFVLRYVLVSQFLYCNFSTV